MPKIKPSISLPFYDLHGELLKLILNVKDDRTVVSRLKAAGVDIKSFGSQRVVMHEDLINAIETPIGSTFDKYEAKSDISKRFNNIFE